MKFFCRVRRSCTKRIRIKKRNVIHPSRSSSECKCGKPASHAQNRQTIILVLRNES